MSNSHVKPLENALSCSDKMYNYLSIGSHEVTATALDLQENGVETSGILELQDSMKTLIEAERRMKAVSTAISNLKDQWENGELEDDELDVVDVYERHLRGEQSTWDDEDIWENENMKTFIRELTNNDEDIGKALGSKVNGHSRPHNDSQEMELTETNTMAKCPLTQMEITVPVKDQVCGHTFEKEAIMQYIKQCEQRSKPAKCVLVGCRNVIRTGNLKEQNLFRKNTQQRAMNLNTLDMSIN